MTGGMLAAGEHDLNVEHVRASPGHATHRSLTVAVLIGRTHPAESVTRPGGVERTVPC